MKILNLPYLLYHNKSYLIWITFGIVLLNFSFSNAQKRVRGNEKSIKPLGIPVASFSATPTNVCACDTVQFTDLSTNGPLEWNWYFPGGIPDTSRQENPYVIYCTPGIYPVALVAINNAGPDSIYVANYITVLPVPVITITPSSGGICTAGSGDSVCFTVSGASTYTWTPTGVGSGMNCGGCPNPCVSPSVTTVYTVIGTSASGCVSKPVTDTVYVGKIVAQISGKDTICLGNSDTLNGAGGSNDPPGNTTYIWSTGATSTQIVVSPITTTVYTLSISEESCNSAATFTVVVVPCPTGINEIEKSHKLQISPNPSNGSFTLSLSNVNEKINIEIYNVLGEKVFAETLRYAQGDNHINLSNQPSGVYFYRVLKESGELVGSGKFIIE